MFYLVKVYCANSSVDIITSTDEYDKIIQVLSNEVKKHENVGLHLIKKDFIITTGYDVVKRGIFSDTIMYSYQVVEFL